MDATPVSASDRLIDALGSAAFVTTAALSRIAAANDLSLTQLRLLGILRDRSPRMADLADRLGLDRSSMTGLVTRAEARGLVERRRSATDGRSFEVALTASGAGMAELLTQQARTALAPYVAGFGAAEVGELIALLERFDQHPASRR